MRAVLTSAHALEVRSLFGQSREVLRALVSVAGWYRVADALDGTWLYAPAPDAPGLPLEEAVLTIVAECRKFLARDEGGDQAHETEGEVHPATVTPHAAPGELALA